MILSRRKFMHALAVATVAVPNLGHAQTLTLDAAKRQGLVGERQNGYLGVVRPGSGVQALVDRVNGQRRALYADVARRNGVSLSNVEALAGQKAINEASRGTVVEGAGGWVTK